MRNPSSRQKPIIARGPETIPQDTQSWQYRAYLQGKRFFEPVLPGQRFPEGADQKQLDELARQRRDELSREAAAPVTVAVAELELPEPETEPQVAAERERLAA